MSQYQCGSMSWWAAWCRYASQSARITHEAFEKHMDFFGKIQEKQLFGKPPIACKGKFWEGFRRFRSAQWEYQESIVPARVGCVLFVGSCGYEVCRHM